MAGSKTAASEMAPLFSNPPMRRRALLATESANRRMKRLREAAGCVLEMQPKHGV